MPSAISAAIWIISLSVGGGRPGLFCQSHRFIYSLFNVASALLAARGNVREGVINLSIRAQGAQVALQVPVGHQLHDHQGGLTFGHHA